MRYKECGIGVVGGIGRYSWLLRCGVCFGCLALLMSMVLACSGVLRLMGVGGLGGVGGFKGGFKKGVVGWGFEFFCWQVFRRPRVQLNRLIDEAQSFRRYHL